MAWVSVGGNDQDNVVHDFRTVFVTQHSTLTGYAGGGMAVQSQREADGVIDLTGDPWSPDSSQLLTYRYLACATTPQQCPGGAVIFEVYTLRQTGEVAWRSDPDTVSSVQWAGPGHVYETFNAKGDDPAYPDARGLIVNFARARSELPGALAESCCLAFSPDGMYAVAQVGFGPSWTRRCALFDVSSGDEIVGFDPVEADHESSFCTFARWTPDGSKLIVSQGGSSR